MRGISPKYVGQLRRGGHLHVADALDGKDAQMSARARKPGSKAQLHIAGSSR